MNSSINSKWNVDFTLALHNRTGKFFIGSDILDDNSNLIREVYAWRVPLRYASSYIASRIVGRLWEAEFRFHELLDRDFRALKKRCRMLHMDPMTASLSDLNEQDIVICHDLGPITHPDLFEAKVTKFYTVAYNKIKERRPRMIFISRATANAFTAALGLPSRSRIIYPPLRVGATGGIETTIPGINSRFLLTVGSLGRRKNQETCIRAYARSGLYENGVQYILCGSSEVGFEQASILARDTPGVTILPYVSDAQLRWLYNNAMGFVLMSRLEGFGMPVSEAISYGCIPLVTRGSVLEEVAGGAALLSNADSIDEIAAQMCNLIDMQEPERVERRAELRQSIQRFTHDEFCRQWRHELIS